MSAKRAKGLTRKITLDHALSYERTVPNGRGVTALAELNGTGAYERRYARAKRLLKNGDVKGNPMSYTAKQKSAMKRMTASRRASFKKMLAASGYRPNRGRSKYRRNLDTWGPESAQFNDPPVKPWHGVKYKGGKPAEYGEATKSKRGKGKGLKAKAKKVKAPPMTRAKFIAFHEAQGWSKKKIKAAWGKSMRAHRKPVKARRVGGYTQLLAQVGNQKKRTYMYARKGKVRHIPEYAVLGYKSKAHLEKDWNHPEKSALLAERRQALKKKRERLASAAYKRVVAGRDMFSPNTDTMTFEEWKAGQGMKANKKRAKKAKKHSKKTTGGKAAFMKSQKRKGASTAQAEARWKFKQMAGGKKGKKALKKAKKHVAKSKAKKHTKKTTGLTKHQKRVRAGKRAAATRRRNAKAGHKAAPKRRKARKGSHKTRKATRRAAPKRRKARRMTVKRITISMRANRRHYRRNVGSQYVSDMKDVLKIGAVVVVGYAAHRALSRLFDDYAMSKISQLNTGSVATWRPLISATVVAAVGIPAVAYLAGKTSMKSMVMPVAAGMAASLLHNALLTALGATGNASASKVAGYLSAYPDAGSRAYNGMGSYYGFKPRQVFGRGGTGEFYEVLPQSGFGLDSSQMLQAAAGFGAPVMQAAAGFGAEVTQAAAGTGEYVVYGAEGIGEYEEVPPTGSPVGAYDGILPTLDNAEYALNVAEAAAGFGDLPMQSTVDPVGQSQPIAGAPGGSRAGILQGGDGIFGG